MRFSAQNNGHKPRDRWKLAGGAGTVTMNRMRWRIGASIAASLIGVSAFAQTTSDQSGDDPRAAARAVILATAQRDAPTLQALMDTPDDAHRPLVEATAQLLVSGRRLADAATARFGPVAGAQIADGPITPVDAGSVDQARVEVTGDRADVYLPGQTLPMKFVRRDGAWRLSIAHHQAGQPENVARQSVLLRMTADALDECAREIEQDRYANPNDAEAAIKQKLNLVLMRHLTPTTGPVAPSSQPVAR